MHATWLVTMTAVMLVGCMPSKQAIMKDRNKYLVDSSLQHNPLPDPKKTGSLWTGASTRILSDPKAHKVGDLVTVLIHERASASRELGTKKAKKSTHKTSLSALFGVEARLARRYPSFQPDSAFGVSDEQGFDGTGSTNNSDTLTASITAVVTKVYPNGNMQIVGRREVVINHQPQVLVFTGVIRPVDISADNTISSAKVAQAHVSYGGGGELANVAHEGWLTQLLEQLWPF